MLALSLRPSAPLAAAVFRSDHPPAGWRAALAGVALLTGCDSDFEPYNLLASLRVLAIAGTPASLAPGEVSTLTPLLFVPGADVVTSSWSWCPVDVELGQGGRCPLTEEEAALGLGLPLSFDLGSDGAARFEHGFEPAVLERLCSDADLADRALGALDCSQGLPIQIRYVARTASDEVVSVRRLLLRFLPEHVPNANPSVDAVSALVSGATLALDDAGTIVLPRETDVQISASVPESAAESVAPRTATDAVTRERLALTWFVEAGETLYERTSFVEGSLPLEQATVNTWTLPSFERHAADAARLVVVVRDSRGGVGWRTTRVSLGNAP